MAAVRLLGLSAALLSTELTPKLPGVAPERRRAWVLAVASAAWALGPRSWAGGGRSLPPPPLAGQAGAAGAAIRTSTTDQCKSEFSAAGPTKPLQGDLQTLSARRSWQRLQSTPDHRLWVANSAAAGDQVCRSLVEPMQFQSGGFAALSAQPIARETPPSYPHSPSVHTKVAHPLLAYSRLPAAAAAAPRPAKMDAAAGPEPRTLPGPLAVLTARPEGENGECTFFLLGTAHVSRRA